jgi:hypothetical protein
MEVGIDQLIGRELMSAIKGSVKSGNQIQIENVRLNGQSQNKFNSGS